MIARSIIDNKLNDRQAKKEELEAVKELIDAGEEVPDKLIRF